jgi:hypothetical protein
MSPAYGTLLVPSALDPGDSFLVFNSELVTAGEYSERITLRPVIASGQKGVRVQIDFSADPGAGEFYIMEGDNDAAGVKDYDQVPSGGDLAYSAITTGPNGINTRLSTDLIPVAGQMMCGYVKTAPSNAGIKVIMRFTRAV